MPSVKKPMRFAHSDGHTDVTYDPTGKYIVTCGSDGDVRIWDGFEDDDPTTHTVAKSALALACTEGRFYVSVNSNCVFAYTFPDGSPDGVVTRFTSDIYHIVCSEDGKALVAAGGDFSIKVVDTSTSSQKVFNGHTAPVLSCALDPKGEYVASSSCDGTVRVWNAMNQQCIKTWTVVPKSNDFSMSKTLCRISWSPKDGQYLAVPVGKEIQLLKRSSWDLVSTLKDDSVEEMISLVAYSSCGLYIAACTIKGEILIWNSITQKCVERHMHDKGYSICGMAWNPVKKEIAFCDIQGQLGGIEGIESVTTTLTTNSSKAKAENADINEDSFANLDFESDGNDDDLAVSAAVPLKKNILDDDDDDGIDIGAIKATYESKIFQEESNEASEIVVPHPITSDQLRPVYQGPPPPLVQPPFQPGSTPVNLQHRFMVWNSIGIVRSYNTEEENTIDVEFHDTLVHHQMHLSNVLNHTMAALSDEALLLACQKDGEASSKLVCIHFGTWDSNKEWTMEMHEEEEIEAITIGSGWVAVATDARIVRIFSVAGLQREILSLPGPIVCLAGGGDSLMMIYHQAAGLPGEQSLGMMVFRIGVKKQKSVSPYPVPLSVKAMIAWAGFSDEGTPCYMDSSGIVRILNNSFGQSWLQIANTKAHTKGKSDHYFLVGISEIQQQIRCIPCKGSRYPPVLPRPAVSTVPFQLPLCEQNTEKGKLEEEYWRSSKLIELLKLLDSKGLDIDTELRTAETKSGQVLLKLFAMATQSDREFRATEVAKLIPSERILQGAIQYAARCHHLALAERVSKLAQELKEEEEEETNEEEEEAMENEEDAPVPSKLVRAFSKDYEVPLQPKPLKSFRSNSLINGNSSSMTDEDEFSEDVSNEDDSQLKSGPKNVGLQKNPFKKSTQPQRNLKGIDAVIKEGAKASTPSAKNSEDAPKNIKITPKQSKLFSSASQGGVLKDKVPKENNSFSTNQPSKSGFQLYIDSIMEDLKEEHPHLDEDELVKIGIAQFKKLPAEERKKWNDKSKENLIPGEKKTTEDAERKRKATLDDNTSKDSERSKKPKSEGPAKLSSSTTSKIAGFMFQKQS